jgi:hypothetical protein
MQFVETATEAKKLVDLLDANSCILHVYYQNNNIHPVDNKPLALMAKVNEDYYIVSFNHPDSIKISEEYLAMIFATNSEKVIFDRKRLLYHVSDIKNAVDGLVCSYLNSTEVLEVSYPSRSHDFRSIPIMKLFNHFKELCSLVTPMRFPPELVTYEHEFSNSLFGIEKHGMYVENFNLGNHNLVNKDNLVFTQYNMLTPTGRPSNSFGNVNYVALNKKTGQRDCFKSRFGDSGLLVMVDYESYHLRLVGNFLNYSLPDTSIHEYLGKIYHNKETLTEDEYELSKKITFNLIYGGIDDDIKNNVPFMREISEYIDRTYKEFTLNDYVETWQYNRKIKASFFGKKINPNKVFNYLLQAAETERNCKVLSEINSHISQKQSKLILYTYDAFLFDVHRDEFSIIKKLDNIITSDDRYPVRTYIGKSYGAMREL